MKSVFKYKFAITDRFELSVPYGAEFLHAENQHGVPTIWALVDPDHEPIEYKFLLCGTGHEIRYGKEYSLSHISTWQDDPLVWHLFELIKIPFQT